MEQHSELSQHLQGVKGDLYRLDNIEPIELKKMENLKSK